jgi:hypothetical protein
MPQHGPERDEHGRFISNDDHRGGRGYGGGSSGGGRGRMMEEDDRGRGMQSGVATVPMRTTTTAQALRWRRRRPWLRWSWRRPGGSQPGRLVRRFPRAQPGIPPGWQTRYREGTEHDSGWHGDPQGHSDASRRGWETRYREGTEHDSGWRVGDRQGHLRSIPPWLGNPLPRRRGT